jgi:hypothetical protein
MNRDSIKASVSLPVKDWWDLINFVGGDLANMDENPIKAQMKRICDAIKAKAIQAEVMKGGL